MAMSRFVKMAAAAVVVAGLGLGCPMVVPGIGAPTVEIAHASETATYADGTCTACGKGIGGDVPVTVVIRQGKIASVEIGENSETQGIGSHAIEQLPALIVEAGGTDGVDGVSGATITSKAIFVAVDDCLSQASDGLAPAQSVWESVKGSFETVLDAMSLDDLLALRQSVDERITALQGDLGDETASSVAETADYVGAAVDFEGFSIAVAGEYTVADGSDGPVIRVPLSITNQSSSTGSVNMFYIKYYGSKGTALDVHYFGYDDELARGMDMRDGATAEAAAYLNYDGDGNYYISFDNLWDEPIEICVPVQL